MWIKWHRANSLFLCYRGLIYQEKMRGKERFSFSRTDERSSQHTRLLLCNDVEWRFSTQEAASLFCRFAA
jgi:hypothetical protein